MLVTVEWEVLAVVNAQVGVRGGDGGGAAGSDRCRGVRREHSVDIRRARRVFSRGTRRARRVNAVTMSMTHGQVRWNRTMVWPPVRAIVAAAWKTRWRSRFGSATRSAPSKHRACIQAMRSCAESTNWSHASLHTTSTHGRFRSPVSFVARSGSRRRVVTVTQLQRGDVRVGLISDEHLVAEPLRHVEQGELRAGMWTFVPGDHPGAFRPPMVDETGELDDPRAIVGRAVGLDRGSPVFFLGQTQGVADPLIDRKADREPHLSVPTAVHEVVCRAGGVGAHQHLDVVRRDGKLGEGPVQDLEVICGVVRSRVPRPQQSSERFTGRVQVGDDRIEPEPSLVGRCRILLLGMRVEEGPVDVDHDLARGHARRPHPSTSRSASHSNVAQPIGVDRVDHRPHRRIRRDRPEQFGLVA